MAQSGSQSQLNLVVSRYLDVLESSLPIDEWVSLSKLSPSDVPAWADARIQHYERRIKEIEGYIATFRSLRNTQSSIHVLPSELLAKIFVYACTTRRDLQIARVCRHWNAVITSTPLVWANTVESEQFYLRETADQDFLRVALAKSGSLPLSISTVHWFHRAWNILSPHSFQLVSLAVHVVYTDQVATLAAALHSGSLPNLRTLRATCGHQSSLPQLLLDSQYLPRLRELYIESALLTSTFTVGSTLEDLTISGEVREPWHVLGQALQRCVALKTLVLLSTMPEESADQADSYDADLQAVSLPQLRSLSLRDQAKHLRKMLHCLHIPSSTAVNIMMTNNCDGETFLDAVPHDYMQRFHTQSPLDYLHISQLEYSPQTVARCYAGGQERLCMGTHIWEQYHLHGFLEPLFAACEHGALHTLAIDIMKPEPELTAWNLVFERLPHLRRLEFFGPTSTAVRVHFTATFLRCGNRHPDAESSGLSLAWVVPADPEEGEVLLGLEAFASVLEGASTRCGRLEIYATKPSKMKEEFQSLAAIPTDPDLFRTVAAPILPRLASLVDVLTIH